MNHADTHTDLTPHLENLDDTASWKQYVPDALLVDVTDIAAIRAWFRAADLDTIRAWFGEARKKAGVFFFRRSLMSELLLLQLVVSIVIGIIALSAFRLASNKSIDDNMSNWGEQWLGSLDEIGMPLYISGEADSYLGVEAYIKIFPEIAFVRFYDDTGTMIFEDVRYELSEPVPQLPLPTLMALINGKSGERRHLIDQMDENAELVRVGKPIWTEALMLDGLLGLDMNDDSAVTETLVGFVEIGLDTSKYRDGLRRMLGTSLRWGLPLLLLLCCVSWFIYRHALRPLAQLQLPLQRLAQGHRDFTVKSSGHMEIAAIADALNTTLSALKQREEKLFFLANHDSLTGLVNRHRFMEKLEQELERVRDEGINGAVLFIDLDHFKYLNDTAGHAAGDSLLKDIAEYLVSCVREQDTVARLGGDEFVILLSDIGEQETRIVCEKLVKKTGEHSFVEKNESFTVRCSIGATFIRHTEFSATELMSQADLACHKAKNTGRNRFEIYESSSDTMTGMAKEISVSNEINEALQNDSFVLHFQPIVSLETGKISHYESLVRMRVKGKNGRIKLLLPDAFIPAAIRFDQMVLIDRWVLQHAIQKLAEVRTTQPDTIFTINVSGNMFETKDFIEFLESILDEHGVPMSSIVLEITEQVAIRTMALSKAIISKLSDKGCRFALDDFGAGFSSYSYLKALPVDYIKIDGSFIHDIVKDVVDQKIVTSLVDIARATGKQTIAEHVANKAVLDILCDLGVDYAQGHYLGRPARKLK